MKISYSRAATQNELRQILVLQKMNSVLELSINEQQLEGFITVAHTFDILEQMNDACAHIIAKDGDLVVGFALVMTTHFKDKIPVLTPMFQTADTLLKNKKYIVMGQICIDKKYRKKGVFRGMYTFYKNQLQHEYDCLVTEVATANSRSLLAHKSVGFQVLKTQITNDVSWELLLWDWNLHSSSN